MRRRKVRLYAGHADYLLKRNIACGTAAATYHALCASPAQVPQRLYDFGEMYRREAQARALCNMSFEKFCAWTCPRKVALTLQRSAAHGEPERGSCIVRQSSI
jgi:hypothetical protein